MFEFFVNYENRRAFKKALEELEAENSLDAVKQTQNIDVSRSYKSDAKEEKVVNTYKVFNPLRKPETNAVDLKNFSNWREDKTGLNEEKSNLRKPAFSFDDEEEDEGVSLEIESPLKKKRTPPPQTFNIIDIMNNSSTKKEEKSDRSASSFFMEKYGLVDKKEEDTKETNLKSEVKDVVKEAKTEHKKTTLNELLKTKLKDNDEVKPVKIEEDLKPKEKIKVEVVDFNENKKEEKPKKTTRKPRGKSKKRFDADVISSVDWK